MTIFGEIAAYLPHPVLSLYQCHFGMSAFAFVNTFMYMHVRIIIHFDALLKQQLFHVLSKKMNIRFKAENKINKKNIAYS